MVGGWGGNEGVFSVHATCAGAAAFDHAAPNALLDAGCRIFLGARDVGRGTAARDAVIAAKPAAAASPAVVQLADASVEDGVLIQSVKEHLAGYKAPKHIVRVEKLQRQANGKPDYRWATRTAEAAIGE